MNLVRRLWSRFFSAKRPFKLTGAGWVFILYTIGVGAGAINTGNNLLYLVFGVFLGLLLASGLLSDLSLWGLSVDWTFPESCEAGKPASFFIHVANDKKWLPSLSVSVGLEGTQREKPVSLKVYVPFISAGKTVAARAEYHPSERGWFALSNARFFTRYPFGLLEKWWRLRRQDSVDGLFVTPALFPLDADALFTTAAGDDPVDLQPERGDGSTFFGVREFQESDNPRRIHWKASAKQNQALLIREMELERKFDVALRCPLPAETLGWDDAAVEKFVSFLASALRSFESAGHATHILIGGLQVRTPLVFLALWDPRHPCVQPLEAADLRAGARQTDVLAAYRSWDGVC